MGSGGQQLRVSSLTSSSAGPERSFWQVPAQARTGGVRAGQWRKRRGKRRNQRKRQSREEDVEDRREEKVQADENRDFQNCTPRVAARLTGTTEECQLPSA